MSDKREDAPELRCEVCGLDLSKQIDSGWVSWLHDADAVRSFHVTCRGACFRGIDEQRAHLRLADHHLDAFTGIMAAKRLAQLMCMYEWPKPVRAKCCEFFVRASLLPSASRERLEAFDMMMGGLPMAHFARSRGPR